MCYLYYLQTPSSGIPLKKKERKRRKEKTGRNAIIARVSCRTDRCHLYARRRAENSAPRPCRRA